MNFSKYRTLFVLTLAQCFGQTAAPILVLLGGIVGAQIAPSLDWATLPIAIQIVGLASATIPASIIMSRLGRKTGFLIGSGLSIFASLLAAWAIYLESFLMFCIAAFLIGNYIAILQQYRFAVAESVPKDEIPKCLSFLMLAGIVAAFLGPEVGRSFSVTSSLPDYVGSFLGLAALLSVAFIILLLFYRESPVKVEQHDNAPRPLIEILQQPSLILAVASAAIGFSVMSLIMTATPVSMHEIDQHSLADTTRVIQAHILAMFLPSLFSGILISRFGVHRIIQVGLVLMLACVAIGWGQPTLLHYGGTLILLGIGWNFLFLGGTTLLTQSYRPSERFKVQAVNDFMVFGLQAIGSLSAGALLASLGWGGVMSFTLPVLFLLVVVLVINRFWQGKEVLT